MKQWNQTPDTLEAVEAAFVAMENDLTLSAKL